MGRRLQRFLLLFMLISDDSVHLFCRSLLESGTLAAKLKPPVAAGGGLLKDDDPGPALRIDEPARAPELRPHRVVDPLPPRGRVATVRDQVACLRRFAHHELMAVELFAWALVTWPAMPRVLRRGMVAALADEQRHLQLYLDRLAAHGAHLGNAPLSDYLWRHTAAIREHPAGPAAFLAAMGLTFEQANLDFTLAYRDGFRAGGDEETAAVLAQVHHEEIGHVRLAWTWLRRLQGRSADPVALYEQAVPFPLGPRRAKAHPFDEVSRRRAGLPEALIEHVRQGGGAVEAPLPRPPSPLGAQASGVLLLSNLGAEDHTAMVSARARQMSMRVAGLWAHLHGAGAMVADPRTEERHEVQWPEALGAQPATPVWEWLEDSGGLVPWLATESARLQAVRRGRHWSWGLPDPLLSDKAWALRHARNHGLVPACLQPLMRVIDAEELRRPRAGEALVKEVAAWPAWTLGRAVLKPRRGSSGRGRVALEGSMPAPPPGRALDRLARRGGAVLEPWLTRGVDLSVQGYLDAAGELTILGSTRQLLTGAGIWLGNGGVLTDPGEVASGHQEDGKLREAVVAAGEWLASRRYRGPFGIDAFTFRDSQGHLMLRPMVEINPRFTTGTISLGLLERARQAGLTAACSAWAFLASLPAGDRGEVTVLPLSTDEERPPALLLAANLSSLQAALSGLGIRL